MALPPPPWRPSNTTCRCPDLDEVQLADVVVIKSAAVDYALANDAPAGVCQAVVVEGWARRMLVEVRVGEP